MKQNLTKDMIGISKNTIFGGVAIGIVNNTNLPSSIKSGTGSLIGLSILGDSYKKSKKYL